jgi:hypothetical protein
MIGRDSKIIVVLSADVHDFFVRKISSEQKKKTEREIDKHNSRLRRGGKETSCRKQKGKKSNLLLYSFCS